MIKKRKNILLFLILAVAILVVVCVSIGKGTINKQNQSYTDVSQIKRDEKVLIVYYSYTGTTKRVAEHLQQLTGADLYELTLKNPYTGSDNDVSDRVFKERDDKIMPQLQGELPVIENYDRILIGTPVWNNSMSNPIASYLEETDFENKIVAPFWTYITNQGSTKKDFNKRIKNANIKKGLPIASAYDISDEKLDEMLSEWLKQ